MNKVLEITLKSDICIGSGYSYAGIVDSDSCFDRYGIPYIPARRIKGCLREAAETIGEKTEIFGKWGQGSADDTCVRISNAYIDGYKEITSELDKAKLCDELKNFFSYERVRNYYSRTKAQTAIDRKSGSALRNSLRFTRIINHYDNNGEKEMKFFADIYIKDGVPGAEEKLKKAAKALRHMGTDRNRGLGNVRCELRDRDTQGGKTIEIGNEELLNGDGELSLTYIVRTESPLVLSAENDSNSETYISGRNILGYFAGEYLRRNKQADERFENLFLKNRLVFSPLYPSDEEGNIYVPAPSWLARLKKSGELVNISLREFPGEKDTLYGKEVENGRYYPGNGNQPKKLKGKYADLGGVTENSADAAVREVDTEVIYHHRHQNESKEIKEQLYSLEAISAGQYFSGTITGSAEDVKIMADILKTGTMRLGKSKGAQYGSCRVISVKAAAPANQSGISCKAGDRLLLTLKSDALFMDEETGCYTAETEKVCAQIKESAVRAHLSLKEAGSESYSEIEVKQLSGYYGKWNLKRTALPCVCAGTTFEYEAAEDIESLPGELLVGESNGEGFGMVQVLKKPEKWKVNEIARSKPACGENKDFVPQQIESIYISSAREELFGLLENEVLSVKKNELSASAVGRLTLMLNECVNEAEDAKGSYSSVRDRLTKRVNSIKDESIKVSAREFIKKHYDIDLAQGSTKEREIINRIGDKKIRERLEEECRLHLLSAALVMLKYKAKEGGK